MNTLTIAGILFLLTAILHLVTPLLFRSNKATRPIAAYGIIYLVLGILLLLGVSGWLPILALILTLSGAIGAMVAINAQAELRSLKLFMAAIDIVIVGLLVFHLLGG